MAHQFRRFLPLMLILICSACSSEPSNSQSANATSPVKEFVVPTDQEQSKTESADLNISAFLRGSGPDETATKAFERGMEIATEAKSPSTMKQTFLNRNQGAPDSPSLRSLLSSSRVVVYWHTTDVQAAAPILKESDVIAVPVWNVTQKVAALGNKVFGFGYSTERSFAQFAKFAGNKLKSYRFAILSSSTEPFITQSKAFVEETKSLGNTVVFEETIDSASADFKSLIARAVKENCDTIFAVIPGDALVAFIKTARASSFKGKLLVGDSFFSAEQDALGPDANGIYLVQAWSDDSTLRSQYTAKYGAEPDGVTLGVAALGYDFIQCVQAAGNNPDTDAIAYAWLSTPCEGLTGKTQFSGERIAQRAKRILTVKGQKFELAG